MESFSTLEWAGIAVGALVVTGLLLFVIVKLLLPKPQSAKVDQHQLEEDIEGIPSPALTPGRAKRPLAIHERLEAEALEKRKKQLEEAAKEVEDALQRDRLAVEAKVLKAQIEEFKKNAYREKKAQEAEEKERKRQEQEDAAYAALEAQDKARKEAERAAAEAAAAESKRVEAQAGQTLAQGLAKTRSEGFMARLNSLFGQPKTIDDSVLAELEEILFSADIGVKTASRLVEAARDKVRKNELNSPEKLKTVIRDEIEKIVDLKANHQLKGGGPPHVIMVVGVNGSGKTTTAGKLAAKAVAEGKKVVLAAGDTFRAAAADQLDVWAERAGAELVKGKEDADPSSVVFDGIKRAQEVGADLVIADTAGRLHTKANLMEELKKVSRVIDKAQAGAPHEVLLVLDATMGQNAIAQAREFHDATQVTALALTKLDGTAKGGVIIGICDELKVPVAWAGVGEKAPDLRPFEAKEFVQALFD
ncbi:MAG: signal recognition particle-docking protein FtsY [Myxococcaceae bacterium]|nr:signal recognition particle-docking protein FtsY [Myxococcaceae bacterium]